MCTVITANPKYQYEANLPYLPEFETLLVEMMPGEPPLPRPGEVCHLDARKLVGGAIVICLQGEQYALVTGHPDDLELLAWTYLLRKHPAPAGIYVPDPLGSGFEWVCLDSHGRVVDKARRVLESLSPEEVARTDPALPPLARLAQLGRIWVGPAAMSEILTLEQWVEVGLVEDEAPDPELTVGRN